MPLLTPRAERLLDEREQLAMQGHELRTPHARQFPRTSTKDGTEREGAKLCSRNSGKEDEEESIFSLQSLISWFDPATDPLDSVSKSSRGRSVFFRHAFQELLLLCAWVLLSRARDCVVEVTCSETNRAPTSKHYKAPVDSTLAQNVVQNRPKDNKPPAPMLLFSKQDSDKSTTKEDEGNEVHITPRFSSPKARSRIYGHEQKSCMDPVWEHDSLHQVSMTQSQ